MAEMVKTPAPLPPSIEAEPGTSAWAPLREPLFRALWIAAIISYIGTWMRPWAPAG
jgi:Transmembrane secretion effector